jgi:hypothetical protein
MGVYKNEVVLHATLTVLEEQNGVFVSNAKAQDTGATKTSVLVIKKMAEKVNELDSLIRDENKEEVKAIVDHYLSVEEDPENNYITKVKEILRIGSVSSNYIPYLVALVPSYQKIKDRTKTLAKISDRYGNSKHLGTIGVREEFFVKLISMHHFERDGKALTTYKVADQLGNLGYFFANDTALRDEKGEPLIELFDCFVMKAIPKNHGVGKEGYKETQFTRVQIVENLGKGSEE